MSDLLQKASFDPHLNTKFQVEIESGKSIEVELVEIEEKNRDPVESFSIFFRGPKDQVFSQETYTVKHPEMGEIRLFLVPIIYGKQDGTYYQSVFSRLKETK